MKKRLAIFAHFDRDNIVDDYVIYYLSKLHEFDCDTVFVSTSDLPLSEQNKIRQYCVAIIIKENVGYDFMSYKTGLLSSCVRYKDYDELILCNDSVYGPLFGLSEAFNAFDASPCDFWGITKSKEIAPHIQSYFLVFKKSVILSSALEDFFSTVSTLNSKTEIIERYEIGLTAFLRRRNFKYGSCVRRANLARRVKYFLCTIKSVNHVDNGHIPAIRAFARSVKRYFISIVIENSVNYTFLYWDYVLSSNAPFIKIALLRRQAEQASLDKQGLRLINSVSDYPVSLIIAHLRRTK